MFLPNVLAAKNTCPSSLKNDLAQAASHIKVKYEIVDSSEMKELEANGSKTTYKIPNYAFVISIYNLTSDFYAKIDVTTSQTGSSKTQEVYYEETVEGNYSLYDYNIGDIYNYTITIYSTSEECYNKVFRTFRITKPRYNAYSEYTYCQNSSSYYCQRFVTTDLNIEDTSEFLRKIEVNNQKNNPNKGFLDENKEIMDNLKNNWMWYLLIFLAIAGIITGLIIYLKKKQKKAGWKL